MGWEVLGLQGFPAIFTLISLFFVVDCVIPCQNCQIHAQFPFSYLFLSSDLPSQSQKIPFSQHSFFPCPCFSNPEFGCNPGVKSCRETEAGLGTSRESLQLGAGSTGRDPWHWLIRNIPGDLSHLSLSPCPSHGFIFLLSFRSGSCSFI